MPLSSRPAAAALATASAVAAILIAAAPAQAAAVADTPTNLTTLAAPKSMTAANGRLFVSDGNAVAVLGTDGVTQKSVTGMFGARDVLASPSGDLVYVALSQASAIAVIDTDTLTEVARYTTGECPVHLAFAGSRLFYGAGCGQWDGTIGSVDAATGTDPRAVQTVSMYSAPLLDGAGNTLVAGVGGISSGPVYTYTVDGATVTELAQKDTDGYLARVSISPDGKKVATAAGSPYYLAQYEAATLTAAGSFDTGSYPADVAYSNNGTMIGGGVDSTYGPGGNIVAFDVLAGTQVLSGNAHPKAAYNRPAPVSGTLTWSADDARLYSILDDFTGRADQPHVYYLAKGFETIPAPAVTTTKLTLVQPAKAGAKVRATATVARHPGVTVRFVRTSPAGNLTVTAKTNSAGVATVTIPAPAGGTVTAYYDGDDSNKPSSAKATYKTITTTKVTVSGQYKTVKNVAYFRDKKNVLVTVAVSSPVPGRRITAVLQGKSGTKWRTLQTKSMTLNASGGYYIGLISANKGVQYRVVVKFAGDAYGKPSSGTGRAFIIR
ncbi:YncE family protein [Actinoplanes sp. NPDC049681]|uniref:YncE family protein n=1 Tax=Actinoplanes sp. NPDC049681 TaxID=3363905 RepID=UPI0037920968